MSNILGQGLLCLLYIAMIMLVLLVGVVILFLLIVSFGAIIDYFVFSFKLENDGKKDKKSRGKK